jgi:hypothetical protein
MKPSAIIYIINWTSKGFICINCSYPKLFESFQIDSIKETVYQETADPSAGAFFVVMIGL